MTDEHLLGYLSQRFAASEENIATEALTWILRRSNAARSAVIGLCGVNAQLPADLSFASQVGVAGTGRPDIVATDGLHRERLLIEAKFAAGLTEHQPSSYLKRLPSDESGILLVVAPSARRQSLWSELISALPERIEPAPAPSTVDTSGLLTWPVGPRHSLALTSWRELVSRVLDAVRVAEEHSLARDVEQLLALTEAMDAAAFVPVRPGDLNQRAGSQVHQLSRLVDGAYRSVIEGADVRPYRERVNRPALGRFYYGWYVVERRTEKRIWFGFFPNAWGRHGLSPLWVEVPTSPNWDRSRLLQALRAYAEPGGPGLFDGVESVRVPLRLPEHAGETATVQALADQVDLFAQRLAATVPPGVKATGDDPPPEDSDGEII